MFGYVIPYDKTLPEAAKNEYKADYCGLCRCLGKRYGFPARFLVSYDITFLYALLAAAAPVQPQKACFCPANPFCKKKCRQADKNMEFAADVCVCVSIWKLRDTVLDAKGWKRLGARLLLLLLRRKGRRAEQRLPEFSRLTSAQMDNLHALEQENCPSIDRVADTFATLLQGCAQGTEDKRTQRILSQLLYHTGRYLYLIDALDDLSDDVREHNYNPLQFRYCLENGQLRETDKTELLESIDCSIGMAAAALELLDCQSHRALLENIIYYGMPSVMKGVAAGVFRKRKNRSNK